MKPHGWVSVVISQSIAFLLFGVGGANSEELCSVWSCTHGLQEGASGWAVEAAEDGTLYWAGQQSSQGATELFLCHVDAAGQELACTTWGQAGRTVKGFALKLDGDRVYVAGVSQLNFVFDDAAMILLAFNRADFTLIWQREWRGSGGYNEADGLGVENELVYISGWTGGVLPGIGSDIGLVCYNRDGYFQWDSVWGSEGWDQADGALGITQDRLYIAGRYNAPNYYWGGEALLAWFDKGTGAYLGHSTWGSYGFDDAYTLNLSQDAVYLLGPTGSYGLGGQLFLLKYTLDGTLVWETMWGGDEAENGRALWFGCGYGDLYVGVNTMSYGAGGFDISVLRYRDEGASVTCLGSKTWGGALDDFVEGMTYGNGQLYLSGSSSNFSAATAALLLAVSLTGDCLGQELRLNRPIYLKDEAFRLSLGLWNFTEDWQSCYLVIALEVFGEYWFYPSWGQSLDAEAWTLSPQVVHADLTILEFLWPETNVGDPIGPVFFYSGLMDQTFSQLISEIDVVRFYYQ